MIGIETLLNDDPLLTGVSCRSTLFSIALALQLFAGKFCSLSILLSSSGRDVPPLASGKPHDQPTPIILDARARFPLDSALMRNFLAGEGKRPWVVCDPGMCLQARRKELEDAGCRILIFGTKGTGLSFSQSSIFSALKTPPLIRLR